jgi:L-ascorbate metabolism protein UlaG (beta-lactamase superfamily)
MKKWLFRLSIVAAVLVLALALALVHSAYDTQIPSGYVNTPNVHAFVGDESPRIIRSNWPGNAVDQKGRFINDEFPFLPKTYSIFKWRLSVNQFEAEKRNDTYKLNVGDPRSFLESEEDGILWLGHASFYIRLNGIGILTDPIFETPAFFDRLVDVPSQLEHIRRVDYVLLSHDHRDHMDESSLRSIAQKFPDAAFLAGLRSEDVLSEWKTPGNPVITAGWFEEFPTPRVLIGDSLKIYFHPVRHWSQRFIMDVNWRLWGAYVIETNKATIYFGGDSGYGRHYREVADLHPKIDYFLIGIGAYEPRWVMEPNHNNPEEALQAFTDSRARVMVPMHYGTFDLSDEPPGAPLRNLQKTAQEKGVGDRIRVLAINENIPISGR